MNKQPGARYTSITPPPDSGCTDCVARNNLRAFCEKHRESKPCLWCGGTGHVADAQVGWSRCECAQ